MDGFASLVFGYITKIGKKKGPVFISFGREKERFLFSVCYLLAKEKRKPFFVFGVYDLIKGDVCSDKTMKKTHP